MTLVIAYERLTVPEIFRQSLKIYQHRHRVFLTLSSLVAVPLMVFGAAISAYAFATLDDVIASVNAFTEDQATAATNSNPEEFNDLMAADMQAIATAVMNHAAFFVTILVLQTIVFSVITIAGRGAMIRATAELYASVDAEPQWLQCFQQGLSRFFSLFCAGWLMSFGFILLYGVPMLLMYAGYTGIAVLLFLIGPWVLFYCAVRFTLMFPAIVVENLSALEGLKRSWELSRNAFCDIFCALFGAGIVIGIVANIVVKLVVGFDPLATMQPMGIVVSQALGIFASPYLAILTTVLYFNLRISKEGMNQQVLVKELAPSDYKGVPLLDEETGYDHMPTVVESADEK